MPTIPGNVHGIAVALYKVLGHLGLALIGRGPLLLLEFNFVAGLLGESLLDIGGCSHDGKFRHPEIRGIDCQYFFDRLFDNTFRR